YSVSTHRRVTPRNIAAGLLIICSMIPPRPVLAEPLHLYAAGSLTAAFTDIVRAFPADAGDVAKPVFGPSGVLRERIEHGDRVDVFASADMDQPRRLARSRGGSFVAMFTRNRLCALGKTDLGLTSDNLLDRLLDPSVRLATSTPGADPGGDYAWAVFARAEMVHPGAQATLQQKAMQLVGGPNSTPLVPGRGAVQGIFLVDRADVMLGYCSSGQAVMQEIPDLTNIPLPPALTVGPAYGLIVMSDHPLAARFALFVLSEQGQTILRQYGFDPIGLP
ncbi:MAG TPA: molybdate ABC transporter substrate-binding protein, partial [Ktedonobacterales bacterium]|nr:molybdate ABC transporter substrate-binding protein [Ktedonobacterales bacterium]